MEMLVTSLPVPQVVGTSTRSRAFAGEACHRKGPGWGDMLEDQELGDVQHPAAAHGNDPGDLLGHIPVDGLHHLV